MEMLFPFLGLLVLAVPISAGVRLVAALYSGRVRQSIGQHPIAHALWFLAAAAVVILALSSLLPALKNARGRTGAARDDDRVANQALQWMAGRHVGFNSNPQRPATTELYR